MRCVYAMRSGWRLGCSLMTAAAAAQTPGGGQPGGATASSSDDVDDDGVPRRHRFPPNTRRRANKCRRALRWSNAPRDRKPCCTCGIRMWRGTRDRRAGALAGLEHSRESHGPSGRRGEGRSARMEPADQRERSGSRGPGAPATGRCTTTRSRSTHSTPNWTWRPGLTRSRRARG